MVIITNLQEHAKTRHKTRHNPTNHGREEGTIEDGCDEQHQDDKLELLRLKLLDGRSTLCNKGLALLEHGRLSFDGAR